MKKVLAIAVVAATIAMPAYVDAAEIVREAGDNKVDLISITGVLNDGDDVVFKRLAGASDNAIAAIAYITSAPPEGIEWFTEAMASKVGISYEAIHPETSPLVSDEGETPSEKEAAQPAASLAPAPQPQPQPAVADPFSQQQRAGAPSI